MDLRLHHVPPSPNCMKVRQALGFKGLEYESLPTNPADRRAILAATGQSLTPAIEHGSVRLFDSSSILRYLDANFRDQGGRLFAEDSDAHYAIERWERHSLVLKDPVGATFRQYLSGQADEAVLREASAAIHAATSCLEEQLASSAWLEGDQPADFACAPFVYYAAVSAEDAADMPLRTFFREHLDLGDDRDRTRDWVARACAFDR